MPVSQIGVIISVSDRCFSQTEVAIIVEKGIKAISGEEGQLTVAEAGRRGGQSTLERRGIGFFQEIGRKGGKRTAELYRDLLKEFGKHGGRPHRPSLIDMGEDYPDREGGRGRP
jgi:general stress protein YciG